MRVLWVVVLLTGAAIIGLLCFAWPAAVALIETLTTPDWALAALGGRRVVLLARGVAVAIGAAVAAQILGAGLACGLLAGGRGWLRAATGWLCFVVLLTPPYLYAYAWSLPVTGGFLVGGDAAPGWTSAALRIGRAVWCLAAWTAPVAAAVIVCGWRASGRAAYRLALLDASPFQAVRRSTLALMAPWLLLSVTATGVLALTEYAVCHLCLVQTWNTEVLAEVQLVGAAGQPLRPGQALLLAWPLVALVGGLVLAWWPYRRMLGRLVEQAGGLDRDAVDTGQSSASRSRARIVAAVVVGLLLLAPWLIFALWLEEPAALVRAWYVYPREWPDGLLCAGGSVLAALWLALGVDYVLAAPRDARPRWIWLPARIVAGLLLVAAAIAAAAPPALVGDAFLAAYARVPLVIDHWPVVSLVAAARFALIALVVVRVAGRAGAAELRGLAATDGASWSDTFLRVRLPACAPALLFAGVVVGLLSFTELAASSLVRPPGVDTLALTLLNALHYGRDDDVIAMSLYLMLFVALIAAGAQWSWSRLRRRAS